MSKKVQPILTATQKRTLSHHVCMEDYRESGAKHLWGEVQKKTIR